MNQTINSAFAKLLEYERRSRGFAPDAEGSGTPSDEWSGVTFSIGDTRLACNITRISEILPCPQSTPVPGAKPWIVGLANVRGELLTVIDLAHFLSGHRSPVTPRSRLLATSINKAPIGLLIDDVFGQRRFLDSDAEPPELDEDAPLTTLVSRRHQVGTEVWHELDLDRLLNSADFLNGSAH
jgi:twitching motility protein PilI